MNKEAIKNNKKKYTHPIILQKESDLDQWVIDDGKKAHEVSEIIDSRNKWLMNFNTFDNNKKNEKTNFSLFCDKSTKEPKLLVFNYLASNKATIYKYPKSRCSKTNTVFFEGITD
jgi:hypothetical protein